MEVVTPTEAVPHSLVKNDSSSSVSPADLNNHSLPDVSVTPAYSWKHGKSFFLSKKESIVAEEFLKTRSYREAQRKLKEELGYDLDVRTIKKWLGREWMASWLAEKFEEAGLYSGWTKEHFVKVLSDHITGKEVLNSGQLYSLNLMGKYRGYELNIKNNGNLQINFTEKA